MLTFRVFDFIVRLLPSSLAIWIARRLGSLFFLLDAKHRGIALSNLRAAFPHYPQVQILRIARNAFQHLCVLGAELLILSVRPVWAWRDRVDVEGLEHVEHVRVPGKSVLFLTGHAGNWELAATMGHWAGLIETVIARDIKSPGARRIVELLRARYGVKIIDKGQLRHIVQEFRAGRSVGALIDQDAGLRGTFVEFFGRPASTPAGVIRLALKEGIPVLPAFLRRTSDRMEFRLWIGGDLSAGLEHMEPVEREKITLERYTRALEKFVREDPGQWLWLHRRWKTRPPDERLERKRKALVLNDGKAGHFNQILGVLNRMQLWESIQCPIRFRSPYRRVLVFLMGIVRRPSMNILLRSLAPESVRALPLWSPPLILACGSTGASAAYILKHYYGSKAVVLMRSGYRKVERLFDLAILPVHDRPPKSGKVVSLFGMPTPISEAVIRQSASLLAQRLSLGVRKKVGVLVGGPSRRLRMNRVLMDRFAAALMKHCGRNGMDLVLATSRRTPQQVEAALKVAAGTAPFARVLLAQDYPDNPIPGLLGLSDLVVVTEDSFSMIMESVHSGRPVITLRLPRRGIRGLKYEKTLRVMEDQARIFRTGLRHLEDLLQTITDHGPFTKRVENTEAEQASRAILELMGDGP